MKQLIVNAAVITPERVIPRGGVAFEDGKITAVFEGESGCPGKRMNGGRHGPGSSANSQADKRFDERFSERIGEREDKHVAVYDAGGLYVSPGFIDAHAHGGGGYDFMDGTAEDVGNACKAHMLHGATTIVPTSVACAPEELCDMLDACREAARHMRGGPNIPGVHLEGPYFNPAQAGAQNPGYIKNPDPAEYLRLLDAYPEIIRWSAAPELPGGLSLGRELARRGVLASIAHSDAIWEEARAAYENGYTHATHLYSGMSATRRISAYRHGGVVETAYLIDGMTVELIADGRHLPEELIRLAVKIKGSDRVALVTDAMRMAGVELPDGAEASLGSKRSAVKCVIEDGVAKTPDRLAFAGSVATADRLVRTAAGTEGISLREAVRMVTATPARIMGFKTKGALREGLDADIVVFDGAVNVKAVFVGGALLAGGEPFAVLGGFTGH